MNKHEIIEKIKDMFEIDVIEKEEKLEAKKFARNFGNDYLKNPNYKIKEVVDAINMILTKIAKESKRFVDYIIKELQTRFPEINKKYQFKITA